MLTHLTGLSVTNAGLTDLPLDGATAGRLHMLGLSMNNLQDLRFMNGCSQLQFLDLGCMQLGSDVEWLSESNLRVCCLRLCESRGLKMHADRQRQQFHALLGAPNLHALNKSMLASEQCLQELGRLSGSCDAEPSEAPV